MRYEYIGKKEIYSRVTALGYELPSKSYLKYSHFEGVERLTSRGYKITVQRGGDWLQVVDRQVYANNVHTYVRYYNGTYLDRY